jgi:hypothetical protein
MNVSCPCCHAQIDLLAALEDETARDFVGWLSRQSMEIKRPLVAYLALHRSRTRAMAWERCLRIGKDVVALSAEPTRLAAALSDTVESLRRKQQADPATWRPLDGRDHNYLKAVLRDLPAAAAPITATGPAPAPAVPQSRTGIALAALEAYTREGAPPELVRAVCRLLQGLVVQRLENQPALETITLLAGEWIDLLQGRGADALAVTDLYSQLRSTLDRWPTIYQILQRLPRRPDLPRREPTTEEVLAEHARLQAGLPTAPVRDRPTGLENFVGSFRRPRFSPPPPTETAPAEDAVAFVSQLAAELERREGASHEP